MRSFLAGLRQLVVPWGAGGSSPRIVIGPDVPPLIATFDLDGNTYTTHSAIIFYTVYDTKYHFQAVTTNDDFGTQNAIVKGYVDDTIVWAAAEIAHWSYLTNNLQISQFNTTPDSGFMQMTWQPGTYYFDGDMIVSGAIYSNLGSQAPVNYPLALAPPVTKNGAPGALQQTNSAAFVNLAVPASFSWDKLYDDAETAILVVMGGTFFSSNAATGGDFGVSIDGSDSVIARHSGAMSVNNHETIYGAREITGFDRGTYTIQPRWRRSGALANINADAGDDMYVTIQEVGRP